MWSLIKWLAMRLAVVRWIFKVLGLVAFLLWKLFKNYRKRKREMAVIAELRRVRTAWLQHADSQRLAADLSQFLRRLSRAVAPDSVALNGEKWLAFLDRHGDGFREKGAALTQAQYRPGVGIDADGLYTLVERHLYSVLHKEGRHV